MKEVYLGSEEDRKFIAGYLALVREITPYEMFLTNRFDSLRSLRSNKPEEAATESRAEKDDLYLAPTIDLRLFDEIVSNSAKQITSEYSAEFELIPEDRYYIGYVSGADTGGFHSKRAVGYHSVFKAAFTVALNSSLFPSEEIRTLDLARNYLHDSVHYSTFCSYRRLIRHPVTPADSKRTMPEVYREQYGINFRNAAGLSYSSPKLTLKVPVAINLNLLMDGIGVEVVASTLNRQNINNRIKGNNAFEGLVLDEVLLQINEENPGEWGQDFFFEVVLPTRKFLARWGGEAFRILAFRAMMEGNLAELTRYFERLHGQVGAWEKVFRQAGFSLA